MPALPESVWQHIAGFLAASGPEHLLCLGMVCRATNRALADDHPLWIRMLRQNEDALWKAAAVSGFYRVATSAPLPFVSLSPCPDFLHNFSRHRVAELRQYRQRTLPCIDVGGLTPDMRLQLARHSRKRACLQSTKRCGMCGARRHHYPFWGLGMRVCKLCLKQNLVSGSALYLDYGLDFTKNRLLRSLAGSVFFFGLEKKAAHIRDYLSHNPADFASPGMPGEHTFFWKPHLLKQMDLPACKTAHLLARALVPRVTAAIRALCVRLVIGAGIVRGTRSQAPAHSFLLRTLPEAERTFMAMYLPAHLSPTSSENGLAARASVQRLFLSHPVRLVITCAASPVHTWSTLMTLECTRPGKSLPAQYLPRMKNLDLVDTILYQTFKEKPVGAY